MPRARYRDSRLKIFVAVFVVALSVGGYLIYSLYAENQSQARTIIEQAQDIVSKAEKISSLQSRVENLSIVIANQSIKILGIQQQLTDTIFQVNDLSEKLGSATQEIQSLQPKVRDYYVVGVDSSGRGVVVPVEVKVAKGSGSVSASINNVDLLSGAQDSIRTAASVASRFAKVPTSDKDITVTFVYAGTEVVTVDGPSAGAAITSTIVATLLDKDPRRDVLTTGTISPEGFVGPVGSVLAKAQAAKDFGAKTFLVPTGESVNVQDLTVVEVADINQVIARVL